MLNSLQAAELSLLKQFVSYCDKNDVLYFALGGTLLGAVRHGGFIPWDDDIDIGIPRYDYNRLLQDFDSDVAGFELKTVANDPSHTQYFARAEDSSVMVLRKDVTPPKLTPAWIDIFPIDGMPTGLIRRRIHTLHILFRRALFRFSLDEVADAGSYRPWYERALLFVQRTLPLNKIFSFHPQWEKLDRCLQRYPYQDSLFVINGMGRHKTREIFHSIWLQEYVQLPFEDTAITVPSEYDKVLTCLYGDYMIPVPSDDHHTELM